MITQLAMVWSLAVGIILIGFGLYALFIVYTRAGTNMEEALFKEGRFQAKLKHLYIFMFSFVVVGIVMLSYGMALYRKLGGL